MVCLLWSVKSPDPLSTERVRMGQPVPDGGNGLFYRGGRGELVAENAERMGCCRVLLSWMENRHSSTPLYRNPMSRKSSETWGTQVSEKIAGMTGVRVDCWLWAARFFKTRTLAKRACELGRIASNGQAAKAAREVRIGDMLRITNDGGEFEVEVLALSEERGPAAVAQTLYRETEASRELRQNVAAERRAMREFEQLPAGRPSKRDRKRIIQFRGRG